MKKRLVLALIAFSAITILMNGCDGSSSSGDTYTIDGNGTIPNINDDQVLIIDKNVSSVMVDNGGINITCSNGSTCNVQIGDNDNDTTSISDVNNTDSHDIDNHAIDDNSVTNNTDINGS